MKKIPTLFKRDPNAWNLVSYELNPDCAWVLAGEGIATRKYDGTCCRVKNGSLWKRRELKKGASQPKDFEFEGFDDVTGKTVGWMPVGSGPEDQWHLEAFGKPGPFPNGTYELCGPKVQGNPEKFPDHCLVEHAKAEKFILMYRTFFSIQEFLSDKDIEGLVFHHPDGRMAKIKKRDYGMKR